jgi:hypothetical protein
MMLWSFLFIVSFGVSFGQQMDGKWIYMFSIKFQRTLCN